MKAHTLFTSLLCAVVMAPLLMAQHNPETLLYRRSDNQTAGDFTGALPDNTDQAAPFGTLDDPDSSLISALDVDLEPGNGGIDLTGDNHDLAFIFQFYDADGTFSFTENYDDRVKIVATPIGGSGNLNATGASAQHTDVSWNTRTFANFNFGGGGWFNVDIWLTEDGGGAQSAADIGFGYYNDSSTNTGDFGGIGYASTFGVSSGAPAAFDTDGDGQSWGVYLDSFDPEIDSDGDSIPDGYELQYFPGDLTQLGPGDFDGDGVNDPDEYIDGTDPTEADADNDGSNDGQEKAAGTDPLNADSDGDGLLDGAETNTGTLVDASDTGTDPLDFDSDDDSIGDGTEVAVGLTKAVIAVQPTPEGAGIGGVYGIRRRQFHKRGYHLSHINIPLDLDFARFRIGHFRSVNLVTPCDPFGRWFDPFQRLCQILHRARLGRILFRRTQDCAA